MWGVICNISLCCNVIYDAMRKRKGKFDANINIFRGKKFVLKKKEKQVRFYSLEKKKETKKKTRFINE